MGDLAALLHNAGVIAPDGSQETHCRAVAARLHAAGVRVTGDDLDKAYRERNAVVAALIRTNGWPASLMAAPDAEGWWVVYAETPQGQVSWHVHPNDVRLFDDVPRRGADWDGHDTDMKYERVASLGRVTGEAEPVPITDLTLVLHGTTSPGYEFAVTGEAGLRAALERIRDTTLDQPAAVNVPFEDWYRRLLLNAMGIARAALAATEDPA